MAEKTTVATIVERKCIIHRKFKIEIYNQIYPLLVGIKKLQRMSNHITLPNKQYGCFLAQEKHWEKVAFNRELLDYSCKLEVGL